MKKIIAIFLLLFVIPLSSIASNIPKYVITSECITSIKIEELKYAPEWSIIISLNNSAAEEMLKFSKKNIGRKARLVNGQGENILKNEVPIRGYVSSPFQAVGFSSRKEAENVMKSILSTNGMCGEK